MAWLLALGLRPGACVATQLPTGLAFVQLHLAICRLGAVHLPLNPAFPVAELRYFLADSGATLFFHAADQPGAASIAGANPDPPCIALRDDDSFTRQIKGYEPVAPPSPRNPQQVAMMLYTSGTTSRPKGARITHGNLTANIEALHEAWGWRQDDVLLHVLPLFHVHGLTVALHGALRAGATAVLTAALRRCTRAGPAGVAALLGFHGRADHPPAPVSGRRRAQPRPAAPAPDDLRLGPPAG